MKIFSRIKPSFFSQLLLLVSFFFLAGLDGIGQYWPEQILTSEQIEEPQSVYSSDLDGDGDMDILSASSGDDKIAWYENDGLGNFGPQQVITTIANGATSVYATDLDNDGDMDVLSGSSDDKIAWYENNGSGVFGNQQIITTLADGATSVYAKDLDGDGNMDVLSASRYDDKIAWYENDGLGNFGPQQIISTNADDVQSVYASDLDGDGDADVLSASWNDNKIAWYENEGFGTFGDQQIISTEANGAHSVYASDFDGDGDMDVLSGSNNNNSKIVWHENDGFGNFEDHPINSPFFGQATSVYATDIDGDGDIDVLSTSHLYYNGIVWFENDGFGNFSIQQIISTEVDSPKSVFASDLDGDGDMDVLSASFFDDKIAWYENNGLGSFGAQENITPEAELVRSVFAADLDADGDMDILSASTNDDKIAWYENDGQGDFETQHIVSIEVIGARFVYATDIDGDDDMDIVSTSYNTINNPLIAWFENDGFGNFGIKQNIISDLEGDITLLSSDLDGDGDLDLLLASEGQYDFDPDIDAEGKIAWLENDGLGNFGTQQIIHTNIHEVRSIIASDLDGDGDMDVLSSSYNDNRVAWSQNDGLGNFGSHEPITDDALGTGSVFASDLDGDGDTDILASKSPFGDYYIRKYENDGLGNFESHDILVPDEFNSGRVISTDLDGDGDMDILTNGKWLQNIGNGDFAVLVNIFTPLSKLLVSDLDGDGDMDAIAINTFEDKIVWYENIINEGCTDITACNYNEIFVIDNGSCCYDYCGCSNEIAANYESQVLCDDGSCLFLGCTDNTACNYDYYANFDNGLCSYPGCTNEEADNYDSTAQCDDGNCIFYGCINSFACNFDSTANTEDGSCLIPDGCTDDNAYNYNSLAQCDDGSCIFTGCTNSLACNYNEIASIDDDSCFFPDGCTDENAVNYDSSALCNDESCLFIIQGLVFYDENENGFFDGIDFGLPFQEIMSSDNLIYLTNDEGIFYAEATSESINFTLSSNESFPYNTTSNPQTVVNGINTSTNGFTLSFGISSEEPDFAICLDFYPPGEGYPCDDWVNHNLCFRNMGNVPINGILEVEYDSLFQDYQELTPIDSVIGNTIYMSFDSLMPGQMYFYDVSFLTPDFESIGEFLTSTGRVYGYYEGEEVAYGESTLVHEMTCAYDPNDKQVFPNGYADPHYILPETRLEYLVRFQNTGNAPATNVIVTDTIDTSLDLSSFELVANSHSVITTIKSEERVIEFLFENIMLPDSTVNEPDSHGLISYKLTPHSDLDYETEINNTAYIYFDNNPAIITNTAWSTIYDCNNGLAVFELLDTLICQGLEVDFENAQEYIEEYTWYVNNQVTSSDSVLTHLFETADQYTIKLEVSNPLCEASDSIDVPVIPFQFEISDNISLCTGESTILSVSGGNFYDWNGQGNEPTLEVSPLLTSIYEVTVANEFNCSKTDSVEVTINPLPIITISENVTLCLGESTILSASGGTSYDWDGEGNEPTLEVSPLITSNYEVTVTNEFNCSKTDSIGVIVNPLPIIVVSDNVTLCLGESTILTALGGETYDWNGEGTEPSLEITPLESTIYEVTVTNEFECTDIANIDITVNPLPSVFLQGDLLLCEGESTVLTASGGATYDWNGLGTNSTLQVTPTISTTYYVTVFNFFDCSITDSLEVIVDPTPVITLSDDISLCEGESTTLTASGGNSYDWNGQGTNSELEISPTETTTYEVTATNEFDCSITGEVTVFVNPLPTAEITADQITLSAIEAETYQWYLNGNIIDGANAQTYIAQENGNYAVEVTNEFDCTSLSDEIIISVVGIEELSNQKIQLFPNPMQEYSILYFGESGVNYQVTLFDAAGRLVRNYGVVNDGQLEIQRKGLSSGNYLIEVFSKERGEKFGLQLVVE